MLLVVQNRFRKSGDPRSPSIHRARIRKRILLPSRKRRERAVRPGTGSNFSKINQLQIDEKIHATQGRSRVGRPNRQIEEHQGS